MADDAIGLQLRELRKQADHCRRAQARAEAEREGAQRDLATVVEALKTEFGVTSPDQATALVKSLEDQLNAEMQRVREQLHAAGVVTS